MILSTLVRLLALPEHELKSVKYKFWLPVVHKRDKSSSRQAGNHKGPVLSCSSHPCIETPAGNHSDFLSTNSNHRNRQPASSRCDITQMLVNMYVRSVRERLNGRKCSLRANNPSDSFTLTIYCVCGGEQGGNLCEKSNEILLNSSSRLKVADHFKIPRNQRAKFSHVKSPREQKRITLPPQISTSFSYGV